MEYVFPVAANPGRAVEAQEGDDTIPAARYHPSQLRLLVEHNWPDSLDKPTRTESHCHLIGRPDWLLQYVRPGIAALGVAGAGVGVGAGAGAGAGASASASASGGDGEDDNEGSLIGNE